jgi:hypothetical protein
MPNTPDVMDRAGRARRLAVAAVVGIAAAIATYLITVAIAQPGSLPHPGGIEGTGRTIPYEYAWRFIWATTAVVGALAFAATHAIARMRHGRAAT